MGVGCVGVGVGVDDYSSATGYKTTIERYRRPQRCKGLKINVAILLKLRRSELQEIWPENKRKSQYVN